MMSYSKFLVKALLSEKKCRCKTKLFFSKLSKVTISYAHLHSPSFIIQLLISIMRSVRQVSSLLNRLHYHFALLIDLDSFKNCIPVSANCSEHVFIALPYLKCSLETTQCRSRIEKCVPRHK